MGKLFKGEKNNVKLLHSWHEGPSGGYRFTVGLASRNCVWSIYIANLLRRCNYNQREFISNEGPCLKCNQSTKLRHNSSAASSPDTAANDHRIFIFMTGKHQNRGGSIKKNQVAGEDRCFCQCLPCPLMCHQIRWQMLEQTAKEQAPSQRRRRRTRGASQGAISFKLDVCQFSDTTLMSRGCTS